jgi:hypothetical protein
MDTSNWKRPSLCLMPAPPPTIGVGKLEKGSTYPLIDGGSVVITERINWEGEEYWAGFVTSATGMQFQHLYELNGRDWTDNPENPYAIDWDKHVAGARPEPKPKVRWEDL